VTVVAAGMPAPEFKLAREDGTDFTEQDLRGSYTDFVL
jgi:peroxiredoxin